MCDELLDSTRLPGGFKYPDSLLRVVKLQLVHLEPWHILGKDDASEKMDDLKERYPHRFLIPFAWMRQSRLFMIIRPCNRSAVLMSFYQKLDWQDTPDEVDETIQMCES